jgi:hypothetical protein
MAYCLDTEDQHRSLQLNTAQTNTKRVALLRYGHPNGPWNQRMTISSLGYGSSLGQGDQSG